MPDTDTDFDSLPDCIDRCPLDGTKVKPGRCGCGIPDNLPHCRLPTPTPELTATPTPTATPPPPAAALVVTSTGDEPDALAGDGRCQTATGVCTLRAAVQEANARRGFDRIRVPAGTYPLARGPIEIRDGASLQGAGRDATVVDAGGLAPVLYVAPESALAISDLTLRNGRSSQREGAGGVVNEGTLDMRNCDIRDNSATFDGGTGGMINRGQATLVGSGVLSNSSTNTGGLTNTGTLTLYRTALTDNRGGRYGAALRNLGTAEVVTCELRGNIVFGPADAALYNAAHGRLRIRTSRIVDSLAAAALHNVDGEVVVERTVIAGNSDGGIANYNEFGAAGTVTVTESRIEGNGSLYGGAFGGLSNTGTVNVTASSITGNLSASNGGGLLNSGVMTIVNSTISGNQTGYLGGGISNAGTLELQHVTIAENRSGVGFSPNATGGGLVNASGSSLRIARSIIAGNVDESGTAPDCRGTVESVGANILGDSFGCDWPSGAGDLADVDARLGPLDFYGAPTKSHAVFDNSPAIDAAGPAGKDHCAASDQRGIPRPQGAECDIGAFEATRDCGNGRVDGLERCDLGAGQEFVLHPDVPVRGGVR
ncbi:MAG: right-handed parallel beta-helix repeat-containing protein [Candidatus Binatia bacterium]